MPDETVLNSVLRSEASRNAYIAHTLLLNVSMYVIPKPEAMSVH